MKAVKELVAPVQSAMYSNRYQVTGRDAGLVSLTTGGTATVAWGASLFGLDMPIPVAGFIGAVIGLLCARIFKPK